jgi:hypothetical protein
MIDITMTATLRPSLVSQTLESFCRNIFRDRDNYRLIINIDPVGEKVKSTRVLEVCKQYFKNIVSNVPKRPSFPTAVVWCWSKVESDFVFHLEDDWLSVCKIDICDMIRILKSNRTLACLKLSKYDIPKPTTVKLWAAYYTYTGDNHFITNSNNQFGLNPVLIKKEFVKGAIPIMSLHSNPEKQFRPSKNDRMNSLINSWRVGLYGVPGGRAVVLDNGTSWREKNNFKKPDGSFLVWEKYR